MTRAAILAALFFSGLTALVYQILWTRLTGLAFGTSTEAIAAVLAVFFGGLALGNLAAARLAAPGRATARRVRAAGGGGRRVGAGVATGARAPRRDLPVDRRARDAGGPDPGAPAGGRRRAAAADRRDGRHAPGGRARLGPRRRPHRPRQRRAVRGQHARRRDRRLRLRLLADSRARDRALGDRRGRGQPGRGRRDARDRSAARAGAGADRGRRGGAAAAARAPARRLPGLLRRVGLRRDRLRDRVVEGVRRRDGGDALRLRRGSVGVSARDRLRQRPDRAARGPAAPTCPAPSRCCTWRSVRRSCWAPPRSRICPSCTRSSRRWRPAATRSICCCCWCCRSCWCRPRCSAPPSRS